MHPPPPPPHTNNHKDAAWTVDLAKVFVWLTVVPELHWPFTHDQLPRLSSFKNATMRSDLYLTITSPSNTPFRPAQPNNTPTYIYISTYIWSSVIYAGGYLAWGRGTITIITGREDSESCRSPTGESPLRSCCRA